MKRMAFIIGILSLAVGIAFAIAAPKSKPLGLNWSSLLRMAEVFFSFAIVLSISRGKFNPLLIIASFFLSLALVAELYEASMPGKIFILGFSGSEHARLTITWLIFALALEAGAKVRISLPLIAAVVTWLAEVSTRLRGISIFGFDPRLFLVTTNIWLLLAVSFGLQERRGTKKITRTVMAAAIFGLAMGLVMKIASFTISTLDFRSFLKFSETSFLLAIALHISKGRPTSGLIAAAIVLFIGTFAKLANTPILNMSGAVYMRIAMPCALLAIAAQAISKGRDCFIQDAK